jgi:hypothetical protein
VSGVGVVDTAAPMTVEQLEAYGDAMWGWDPIPKTARRAATLLCPCTPTEAEEGKSTREEMRKGAACDEDWAYLFGIIRRQREDRQRAALGNTRPGNGRAKPEPSYARPDDAKPPEPDYGPPDEATQQLIRTLAEGKSVADHGNGAARAEH